MSGGIWLAVDTATDIASVAAGRAPAPEAGAHVQGARRHAAEIIRLVDFTLGRLGLAPRDLEGIVVGDGPGSFTGLRIGWAAAKGLAQEASLDLVAIPSLMAAAAGAAVKPRPLPIPPRFQAPPGPAYGAGYAVQPGPVQPPLAPALLT